MYNVIKMRETEIPVKNAREIKYIPVLRSKSDLNLAVIRRLNSRQMFSRARLAERFIRTRS